MKELFLSYPNFIHIQVVENFQNNCKYYIAEEDKWTFGSSISYYVTVNN